MMDFLDNLRRKPLYVRRQIAVVTSTLLSLAIFSIWVNSWGVQHDIAEANKPKGIAPTAVIAKNFIGLKERGVSMWDKSMEQVKQVAAIAHSDTTMEYNPDQSAETPTSASSTETFPAASK